MSSLEQIRQQNKYKNMFFDGMEEKPVHMSLEAIKAGREFFKDCETGSLAKARYKVLDLEKLRTKKSTIVSTEEALEDIYPINWSEDVLSGKKKVLIGYGNEC